MLPSQNVSISATKVLTMSMAGTVHLQYRFRKSKNPSSETFFLQETSVELSSAIMAGQNNAVSRKWETNVAWKTEKAWYKLETSFYWSKYILQCLETPGFPVLVLNINKQLLLHRIWTSMSRRLPFCQAQKKIWRVLKVRLPEFDIYTFSCLIAMILQKKIVGKSGLWEY